MLASADAIRVVATAFRKHKVDTTVVDPVGDYKLIIDVF